MRTSQRDMRPVAYAHYAGVQELQDENWNFTGEYDVSYSKPISTLMNVSGGRGQADISLFGLTDTFSRTATTQDLETEWDTEMVFWIDADPATEPFDYRVVAVSRTINQVVIALAEVETNEENHAPIISG